ncbi:alpha-glucuronidase family glycosyl hydrolase [Chitinophaga sp. S165]|uniref:alpha-glucuronidase family glycosyl hydrolase n=1 Tax=Chitinophaga sp. S165 TaxID=2135462 RepID=UPI000D7198E9|nr:alpha-glucuronidase family glycosyl hydrolase [Chitinophaga sp. S165]PWV56232.1 alpha-glucuronidase [Chitinophaga sp. S165]
MKNTLLLMLLLCCIQPLRAEDGYDLWLRYKRIDNNALLSTYRRTIAAIHIAGNSLVMDAVKKELDQGLNGLLQAHIPFTNGQPVNNTLIVGTTSTLAALKLFPKDDLQQLGTEGFRITSRTVAGKVCTVITANTDIGVLYGAFHFLRLIQTLQPVANLNITSTPRVKLRLLNHWDNLNRYVERGYAGISIWNWHTLPEYIDDRYIDYARANASIGINGTVLNNVNANATVLTAPYLHKVAALADVLRPYGIKVYLSARFSAPMEIGHLNTADPLNDTVRQWWQAKAKEIYTMIPDFGGFLVKANSEGQPGPQSYGRTHADGANMLADALSPLGGIVIWRAFVYDPEANDRFKQAYDEFTPLDGKFRKNVLVQVKNGPIDFQPREPFSPLFGAMPKTPLMMEFQLTQEYLGQGTHLVYEAPLFKEVLDADTHSKGKNSTVAKIVDGTLNDHTLSGIAGVANIGNERNWTNHPFGQANWYALGRLSWDYSLSSEQIASEWIRQTFSNDPTVVNTIRNIMLTSREAVVNYMTPLGLHHIMGNGHHYGPAPWSNKAPRPDWDPVYYHKADAKGVGFDRTASGSNALQQYQPAVRQLYADSNACSDQYLLWFHHVSWQHKMHSGRTLWNELCHKYQEGVDSVSAMQQQWRQLKKHIDPERFHQVEMLLAIQHKDAIWWRNACLLYFQTFSGMPFPAGYEQPDHTLGYYQQERFPYAPGN